jgi:hypothetical protein
VPPTIPESVIRLDVERTAGENVPSTSDKLLGLVEQGRHSCSCLLEDRRARLGGRVLEVSVNPRLG